MSFRTANSRIAALLVAISLAAPVTFASAATALAQEQRANVYHVYVDGMSCPMCAFAIKRRLAALEGVERVEVDMARSLFLVTLRPDGDLSSERVAEIVRDAGFTFRTMERAHAATK